MTPQDARESILKSAAEAHAAGLSHTLIACETNLSVRTLRRWRAPGATLLDQRAHCQRPAPPGTLTSEQRAQVLALCSSRDYASLPPAQIVADLADHGRYVASESSFYRILRDTKQQHHRGRARAPSPKAEPARHKASAPGQVWVWDITWLPASVKGHFFKLYMIMDLFSRKIVAQEVHPTENATLSEALLARACLSEGLRPGADRPLIVHGDNGSPLKAYSLKAAMEKLGICPSHSRPRVSNDNAHAEALFRTVKYHPSYPTDGFADIEQAREWALSFVYWYNDSHKHGSIGWVTPSQKHSGEDASILQQRREVYQKAKNEHPARWGNRSCRTWPIVSSTTLNPIDIRQHERDLKKSA